MKPEDRTWSIEISHFGNPGGPEDQFAIPLCNRRLGELMELRRDAISGKRTISYEISGKYAEELVRTLRNRGLEVSVEF